MPRFLNTTPYLILMTAAVSGSSPGLRLQFILTGQRAKAELTTQTSLHSSLHMHPGNDCVLVFFSCEETP